MIPRSVKELAFDADTGEQICTRCGTVVGTQRNNDFFSYESYLDIYSSMNDTIMIEDRSNYILGHESKSFGSRGAGLSGIGNNVITSYTETMDFSASGIMSSIMDKKNVDYMGNKIQDTKSLNRIRYINNITSPQNRNPNEKNTKQVILLIKQIAQKKSYPPYIQENAVNLYKDVIKQNNEKRLQYKIATYWCLYYILRQNNLTPSLPEFLQELVELGFIEEINRKTIQKKINKCQTFILDKMDMQPIYHSGYKDNINFLCNRHYLTERVKREALLLGEQISRYGGNMVYQGRSPKTVATMLISIILRKDAIQEDCERCEELLKDLHITRMILRKIVTDIIALVEKNCEDTTQRSHLVATLQCI